MHFDKKIAVNGTLCPVDRHLGIPPTIMQKTIDNLSQDSFERFLTRCFGKRTLRSEIDIEAAKNELEAVQARGAAPEQHFDLAWVSR